MNIRIVKLIKLNVLFTYSFWFAHIRQHGLYIQFLDNCFSFIKGLSFINKHRDAFINDKHDTVVEFCIGDKYKVITTFISTVSTIVWLCEKMKITNIKLIISDKDIRDLFESTLITTQHQLPSTSKEISWYLPGDILISSVYIPSEIGYTMFSKLPVRKELKEQADDWLNRHIKSDWVAVHYRGTDVKKRANATCRIRSYEPDSYIIYLKEVLDSRCRIFVCSDQAQFIDMMKVAFPGRVFARDIQRSDGDDALHLSPRYRGRQQKRDAMVDMLVLAKADLIYTTGSRFISIIRFFNPKIKIISLSGKVRKKNHIPIPRKDLYDSLCIKR